MPDHAVEQVREVLDAMYRAESGRILATLIRLLGDFDLAEDAVHDAFAAALERWPRDGAPANPSAWLVSTGRFKAIDALRRRARFYAAQEKVAEQLDTGPDEPTVEADESIEDDRLRLIFTCCHPVLALEARVALTLREVCGLTTEEIARAFLMAAPTLAQRIVRAKAKIRDARIPYQAPSLEELPGRLAAVLQVVYLVFNEGYSASAGPSLTRAELSSEAIRLGRLLLELLPEPRAEPSPVVQLNRAVALAMRDGPAAGLALIDAIFARGELTDYHLAHSARADLCRRLGRGAEARASYERALSLTRLGPERRFLEKRLRELA